MWHLGSQWQEGINQLRRPEGPTPHSQGRPLSCWLYTGLKNNCQKFSSPKVNHYFQFVASQGCLSGFSSFETVNQQIATVSNSSGCHNPKGRPAMILRQHWPSSRGGLDAFLPRALLSINPRPGFPNALAPGAARP